MATIVCYGDSNTWGAIPMPSRAELGRFAPADRWPGVLQEKLGSVPYGDRRRPQRPHHRP